jgi:hypothetical protein
MLIGSSALLYAKQETGRRVEVHLYGGDTRNGAPMAAWYHSIGITDVWLYPFRGAFPQDTAAEDQRSVADVEQGGTLEEYRRQNIRYWWFERPVPDFFYVKHKTSAFPQAHLWDSSDLSNRLWEEVVDKISATYAEVRRAGFRGVVFDGEAYYSYQGDESGNEKPWLWAGHSAEYGKAGNYYRRGLQIGRVICKVWPESKVIMVYAHGYEGEKWWYRGVQDGGVDLYLGLEHTYGAGPGELGNQWYQSWWQGRNTKQTCDWKRTVFPFVKSHARMIAGLFPIDFGKKAPNYRARYFRQQVSQAAGADPQGPIPVWIWPQGPFTPQRWQEIEYADGDDAEEYLQVLRDYSQAFTKDSSKTTDTDEAR